MHIAEDLQLELERLTDVLAESLPRLEVAVPADDRLTLHAVARALRAWALPHDAGPSALAHLADELREHAATLLRLSVTADARAILRLESAARGLARAAVTLDDLGGAVASRV